MTDTKTYRTVTFRLPVNLYQQIQEVAEREHKRDPYTALNISRLIREVLEEWLKNK